MRIAALQSTLTATARPSGALLAVEGVSKAFGPLQALAGVSLSILPGEIVALLGPNGAGKTTLFQILSGLFAPDAGQVRVLGHDLRRDPVPALARMGFVFQQPTLDPELSVGANLRYHARLHGLARARAEARISEELERAGLADRAADPVRGLSGGNRRRLELARALLHNPMLLLMDEPTVGLDPSGRAGLLHHVVGLCRDTGLGVLWATHLVDEAEHASRVVVLHRGRVLCDAPPATLAEDEAAGSLQAAFLRLASSQ